MAPIGRARARRMFRTAASSVPPEGRISQPCVSRASCAAARGTAPRRPVPRATVPRSGATIAGVCQRPACITAGSSNPAPTRSCAMPTRHECPETCARSRPNRRSCGGRTLRELLENRGDLLRMQCGRPYTPVCADRAKHGPARDRGRLEPELQRRVRLRAEVSSCARSTLVRLAAADRHRCAARLCPVHTGRVEPGGRDVLHAERDEFRAGARADRARPARARHLAGRSGAPARSRHSSPECGRPRAPSARPPAAGAFPCRRRSAPWPRPGSPPWSARRTSSALVGSSIPAARCKAAIEAT